ncbi:MAG TPA: HIT domain-containing protein, partial [Acidimicrobiales bacterium]|nr:HIT domain-containing protein [Acidimicrobiales bacterium]
MSLDHLWAGWRSAYVTSVPSAVDVGALPPDRTSPDPTAPDPTVAAGEHEEGHFLDDPEQCVFCRLAASGPPSAENGVLWRGAKTFAVLNAYPYASGHLMVMPFRHVRSMADLAEEEGIELWSALRAGVAALGRAYGPEGVNIGANLGRAAGAGIPRHLHLHAVPRWVGDTNFMTTVANVRVLPETLA